MRAPRQQRRQMIDDVDTLRRRPEPLGLSKITGNDVQGIRGRQLCRRFGKRVHADACLPRQQPCQHVPTDEPGRARQQHTRHGAVPMEQVRVRRPGSPAALEHALPHYNRPPGPCRFTLLLPASQPDFGAAIGIRYVRPPGGEPGGHLGPKRIGGADE